MSLCVCVCVCAQVHQTVPVTTELADTQPLSLQAPSFALPSVRATDGSGRTHETIGVRDTALGSSDL